MKLLMESLSPENPTVAVRWCLNRDEQNALLKVKSRVFVFIIIAYENGAEDRFLCPLEDAMTHVVFRFAGKHKVFSRLVWISNLYGDSDKKMEADLMHRQTANTYHSNVLDYKKQGFNDACAFAVSSESLTLQPAETIDVDVDAGHFAKEPPEWLKNWVNWMFYTPTRDQCDFRRRAILAFTLQPFIFLVLGVIYFVMASICLLVGALLLARGLHPSSLWLFGDNPGFVWRKVKIDYFDSRLSLWSLEDGQGRKKPWRLLVTPLALLIEASTLQYFHVRTGMGYLELIVLPVKWVAGALWGAFLANLGILIVAVVVLAVVFLGLVLFIRAAEKEKAKLKKIAESPELQAAIEREREEIRQKALEESYAYLTCSPTMRPALSALPPKRRTMRLRFQDFKRDVCRPYAR